MGPSSSSRSISTTLSAASGPILRSSTIAAANATRPMTAPISTKERNALRLDRPVLRGRRGLGGERSSIGVDTRRPKMPLLEGFSVREFSASPDGSDLSLITSRHRVYPTSDPRSKFHNSPLWSEMTSKKAPPVEAAGPLRRTTKDQRRVGAAESEGVGQRDIDPALARYMRRQIDRGFDGGVVEIQRRRRDSIANRQYGENRPDGARCAEEVADRRLGRRHRRRRRRVPQQTLDGAQFDFIADRRRGAMRVDVVDFGSRDARAFERGGHRAKGPVSVRSRRGDVVGVA